MEPLISVIIPVYNVAPYLREALDSVINQTYKNLEIIIIDDGSTDESGSICDEYTSDLRVKVIHQENQGLSGARNTGLNIMVGEYVAFLDPDDAFKPEMIQTMLIANEKYNADLVVCGYIECRTAGKLDIIKQSKKTIFSCEKELLTSVETQRRMILERINVSVWNKLFKSYLLDNIRFPVGYVYEDCWVAFIILERSNKILTLPELLVYHRKRKGSITETDTIKNNYDHFIALRKIFDYVEAHSPVVFTPEDVIKCRESLVRSLTICYAESMYYKQLSHETKMYKEEAISQWKALKGEKLEIKTKVTYILFKCAPFLILPIRKLWRFIKR